MKPNNEYTMAEAIQLLLKRYKIKHKVDKIRVTELWGKILGIQVEKLTTDLFLKDKTLFVKLESAALRTELHFAKEKIISRLNEELGECLVTNIVFM